MPSVAGGPLRGLENEIRSVIPKTEQYDTVISGAWEVCSDGPAPVVLEGVEARLGGGAQLLDVRAAPTSPGRDGIGSAPGPIPSPYAPLSDVTVQAPCSDGGQRVEILLLLRPSRDQPSGFDGFALLYSALGKRYRLTFPAVVAYCPTGKTAAAAGKTGPDKTITQMCVEAGYE